MWVEMHDQSIIDLLKELASEGGKLEDYGLADREDVIKAFNLGLVDVRRGQGWDLWDTVTLTRQQRHVMNLPPILVGRTATARVLDSAAAFFVKLFGKKAH
jgi:hypothetical protein